MTSSSREKELGLQQDRKVIFVNLSILASLIRRLATFIQLTEAEREAAGIHIGYQQDEWMSANHAETADRGHE